MPGPIADILYLMQVKGTQRQGGSKVSDEQWWAVYEEESGKLVSMATVIADPIPEGLSAVECDESANPLDWDTSSKSFKKPKKK